jgi:hypothetical protein
MQLKSWRELLYNFSFHELSRELVSFHSKWSLQAQFGVNNDDSCFVWNIEQFSMHVVLDETWT